SRTVCPAKGWTIWKVRTIPRRAIASGVSRVTSSPMKWTDPVSGVRKPVINAKSVVFPAPFGPMSEVIFPSGTARLTSLHALSPSKLLLNPRISSMARIRFRPRRQRLPSPLTAGHDSCQAARHEKHHADEQDSVKHEAHAREVADQFAREFRKRMQA